MCWAWDKGRMTVAEPRDSLPAVLRVEQIIDIHTLGYVNPFTHTAFA